MENAVQPFGAHNERMLKNPTLLGKPDVSLQNPRLFQSRHVTLRTVGRCLQLNLLQFSFKVRIMFLVSLLLHVRVASGALPYY